MQELSVVAVSLGVAWGWPQHCGQNMRLAGEVGWPGPERPADGPP